MTTQVSGPIIQREKHVPWLINLVERMPAHLNRKKCCFPENTQLYGRISLMQPGIDNKQCHRTHHNYQLTFKEDETGDPQFAGNKQKY